MTYCRGLGERLLCVSLWSIIPLPLKETLDSKKERKSFLSMPPYLCVTGVVVPCGGPAVVQSADVRENRGPRSITREFSDK